MNELELQRNIEYLVNKYIIDDGKKLELISIIKQDSDSAKFVLAELGINKKSEYEESDIEIMKDIAYYYI